jgi:hypothetical protein
MVYRNLLVIAKIIEWVSTALIPGLSAARLTLSDTPKKAATFSDFLALWFLDNYVWIILVLGVLVVFSKLAQEFLDPVAKVRMKATLDAFFATYFSHVPESDQYTNRITLFRANLNRDQLEAFCRSGTQYQRGIQPLKINTDMEEGNEGVAGQAWFRNTTVTVLNLPECPLQWDSNSQVCQHYVREGLLPEKKAEKLKVKSRSLVATPVRDFKGNQWGVLVIDSRRPDGIDPHKQTLVNTFAATLGKLL